MTKLALLFRHLICLIRDIEGENYLVARADKRMDRNALNTLYIVAAENGTILTPHSRMNEYMHTRSFSVGVSRDREAERRKKLTPTKLGALSLT